MAVPVVGTRLHCTVGPEEVIVVREPSFDLIVDCGGSPMLTSGRTSGTTVAADAGPGTLLGKRYVHPASGLELLCVKPGPNSLSVAGEILAVKVAKQLPASD